jgi:hypothetical protein
VNQLIGLLNHDGVGLPTLAESAESGVAYPDHTRCRAPRLPRRIPHGCIAYRQTEPPTPELLDRVLKGLRRL